MESTTPSPEGNLPSVGPSKDERTMAMLCHLIPFAGLLAPHFPVLNIIAPLALWLIKRDGMPFVNDQGKEVLNFQITVSIALVICALTVWLILPFFLFWMISLAAMVCMILGALQANEGKNYRYPFALRLIR